MMKKILFIICMLSGFTAFSQTNSFGKSDPAAKKVLDKASAKFKTYKTVSANFLLRIENASGKLLNTEKGTLVMKGAKYKIVSGDQEIYSDSKNMWTYDKADKEVQLVKVDPSSDLITLDKLFSNFYDKDYLYKLNDDTKSGTKVLYQVELTPRDKSNTFFKVLLDIDKSSMNIMSAKIFEKNGTRYSYTLSSFKTNTPVVESSFAFDKNAHPGVEVVDLR